MANPQRATIRFTDGSMSVTAVRATDCTLYQPFGHWPIISGFGGTQSVRLGQMILAMISIATQMCDRSSAWRQPSRRGDKTSAQR